MSLDAIGRRLLPWLDDVLADAIGFLTGAQEYVEAWLEVLDGEDERPLCTWCEAVLS